MSIERKKVDYSPRLGINPEKYIRRELRIVRDANMKTELDIQLVRLFSLHPTLKEQFGELNLSQLDEAAKAALLAQINLVLGIQPLHFKQSTTDG